MEQAASFGRRGATTAPVRRLQPAAAAAPAAARAPAFEAGEAPGAAILSRIPLVTATLAALLALVFWVEQIGALSPAPGLTPGYRTLTALGGVNGKLVFGDGQWWRVLTAPLLHAGPAHIIGNCVVLLLVGWQLEKLIGRAWFAAIFVASAVGGSLASVLMNPAGPVSVGASGAIMGLLAAAFICSFHVAAFETKGRLRNISLRLAIPALIPTSGAVDYGCHMGGAIVGIGFGFLLQIIWREMDDRPGHTRQANIITAVGGALTLGAFVLMAVNYRHHAAREAGLIPDNELPHRAADMAAQSGPLVLRYPRDPRAHLFRAYAYLQENEAPAAEAEIRTGLANSDVLDNDMPPATRLFLTSTLALTLMQEGRDSDARAAAKPLCASYNHEVAKLKAIVRKAKLCEAPG